MRRKGKELLDEETKKLEEEIQPSELRELQEMIGPEKEI